MLSKTTGSTSTVLTNAVRLDPGSTLTTLRVDSPFTLALNGPLSGSADFSTGGGGTTGTNVGTGTLVLGGNNSGYTGTITMANGTLSVQSPTALGSPAGGTRVSPGATLNFAGPLTYASAEPLSVAGAITATGGSTTFPGIVSLAGPASINVDGSSSLAVAGLAGAFPLVKTGVGPLVVTSTSSISGLNISSGGIVQLTGGGTGHRSMLYVSSLIGTGTLDLTGNDLDVQGGSLPAITALVQKGYAGGAWNGSGIVSSTAANDAANLTAVGVILNTAGGNTPIYTTLDGSAVGVNDVLVKYTYYGDANLNGQVDGSDYSLIDNGYVSNLTGWYNGDFNYDGVIDGSDYTLIDNSFNSQGASLGSNPLTQVASPTAAVGTAAVPEPTTLGVLAMASAGLLSRRKRRLVCIASRSKPACRVSNWKPPARMRELNALPSTHPSTMP